MFLLFSAIAGSLSGLTETINKSVTQVKYSVFTYSLLQWGGNLFFYLIFFVLQKGSFPQINFTYITLLIAVLLAFFGNVFIIKAYKTEDVSNVNIIWQISQAINFANGIFLLSEKVSFLNIIGILIILFGIILIFYKGRSFRMTQGLFFALLGGICFGMISYLNKLSLSNFSPISFLVAANILGTAISSFMPNALRDLKPVCKKYARAIIASRFTSFIAYFLFITSLAHGKISIVNTNYETLSLLSAVFLGIIFLKEKNNLKNKLAGSFFCTVGIILLNFF